MRSTERTPRGSPSTLQDWRGIYQDELKGLGYATFVLHKVRRCAAAHFLLGRQARSVWVRLHRLDRISRRLESFRWMRIASAAVRETTEETEQ